MEGRDMRKFYIVMAWASGLAFIVFFVMGMCQALPHMIMALKACWKEMLFSLGFGLLLMVWIYVGGLDKPRPPTLWRKG
jgi:hypothetical protein